MQVCRRQGQQQFFLWKERYEKTTQDFATCRYLETLGIAGIDPCVQELITTHDQITRCDTGLPLAYTSKAGIAACTIKAYPRRVPLPNPLSLAPS